MIDLPKEIPKTREEFEELMKRAIDYLDREHKGYEAALANIRAEADLLAVMTQRCARQIAFAELDQALKHNDGLYACMICALIKGYETPRTMGG